jgi:transposase
VPRKRRKYSDQFKADAVALVHSGTSIFQVAKDLDLTESALSRWVNRLTKKDPIKKTIGPLSFNERQELLQLRDDVRVLRMERDILKKATAFFAKESQ